MDQGSSGYLSLDLHVAFLSVCCGFSFFSSGLLRISVVLLSPLWLGQSDPVFTRPYFGSLGQSFPGLRLAGNTGQLCASASP